MDKELSIEEMRSKLSRSHRSEFIEGLKNEEDPNAERTALADVIAMSLNRLIDIEKAYVAEIMVEKTICPGCLAAGVKDCAYLEAAVSSMENYIGSETCEAP